MNRLMLSVFVSASLLRFGALQAQTDEETRTYDLAGKGTLQLTVPTTWQQGYASLTPDGATISFSIQYESEERLLWKVFITGFWKHQQRSLPSAEKLKSDLEHTGKAHLIRAKEDELVIREARGAETVVYSFSLTDREPKPDEYLFMTQGAARIGEVVVVFTILSNQDRTEIDRTALEAVRTARHRRK